MANLLSEEEELRRFNAAQSDQPWYARALPMEGRATILPFRDTMPGSVFNKREFALPGLLAEAVNAFTSPARSLLGTDPEFNPQKEAANMALNTFGGGIVTGKALRNPTGVGGTDLALNVYHGTPHEIKGGFDISKVGTGEGAQAYGHGMYFAEAKPVAERYADQLGASVLSVNDKPVDFSNPMHLASLIVADPRHANMSKESLASAIKYSPTGIVPFGAEKYADEIVKNLLKNDLPVLKNVKGNLYKADIPDEQIPKMLDWDNPVSKTLVNPVRKLLMSDMIEQRALDDFGVTTKKELADLLLKDNPTGQQLYDNLIYVFRTDKAASEALSNFGIPGIKYLDEGSRAAGNGTRNFVSFKPETIDILEKNGIKIEDLLEKGLLGE